MHAMRIDIMPFAAPPMAPPLLQRCSLWCLTRTDRRHVLCFVAKRRLRSTRVTDALCCASSRHAEQGSSQRPNCARRSGSTVIAETGHEFELSSRTTILPKSPTSSPRQTPILPRVPAQKGSAARRTSSFRIQRLDDRRMDQGTENAFLLREKKAPPPQL